MLVFVLMYSQKNLKDVLKRGENNFDILRLFAALAVIIGHSYSISPEPPYQDIVLNFLHFDYSGSLAVKFFFFLSGLLVTNSIIAKPDPFSFLLKRALRIFPGLLVCLLISVFMIGPLFTHLPLIEYFSMSETWRYISDNLFLYNIRWKLSGVFTESKFGLNGSLWTLSYEILCYLYLAVFYGLGFLRNKVNSNIFFTIIIGVSFFAPLYLPGFFSQNPEAHLLPGCFSIGALFAVNKENIQVGIPYSILFLLLIILLKDSIVFQFVFYIALFYMTVVVASLPYVVQKIKLPFDASFGVYIYGFVIQQCLHAVFPEMGVHSHQVISSLLAIGFGVFSWQFVEKRFIKLGNEIRVTDFINFINKKSKVQIENIPQTQQIFFNDRVLGIDIKKLKSSKFIFLISFTLVAAVIHALVLKFVFPGYYSPLYPLHSDYYIPAAVANSSLDVYSFSGLLTWPRPVHITFMKIIGYTGIQGSIACVIALVCINTALGALLLKYIFKIPITKLFLLFFILYCFLLFSQPYFYIFYAQDIGSQLSYFFLLIGALVYFFKYEDSITFANISLFVFCFLAFLSKETYGLVGLSSAFLWFIYYRRKHAFNAFIPMIATGSALVIAFAINILVKSSFINPDAEVNSDYHISLNPMLVIPEWLRYANESINIVNIIVAILILFLVIKSKNSNRIKLLYLLAGCIIATGLSWVPNAILPNHHFKGYSFNGAYLFYLPLLILPVVLFEKDKAKGFSIAVVVLCLLSPVFNKNKYSDLDNTWVLIQEGTQRNLLKSLDKQIGRLEASSTPQKIIIQGISFPFHPFSHPEALRVFSNAKFAHFDVVNTNPSFQNGVRTDLVKFISPSDTLKTRYDERWQFDDQGNLIAAIDLEAEKVFLKPKVRESAFIVTSESLPLHKTEGFYNLEGNLRWTNGEASIGLDSTISVKDSVILKLDTFMPPICKNVSPELKIVGSNNKIYKPRMFMRSGDTFYFLFLMNNSDSIKKIDITSERIDASPDLRILSFPFVRLEVIKK